MKPPGDFKIRRRFGEPPAAFGLLPQDFGLPSYIVRVFAHAAVNNRRGTAIPGS